jgi:hypothetical protein
MATVRPWYVPRKISQKPPAKLGYRQSSMLISVTNKAGGICPLLATSLARRQTAECRNVWEWGVRSSHCLWSALSYLGGQDNSHPEVV